MARTLGEYVLDTELGTEGAARVWWARGASGEAVRLKVLRPELIPKDRALRAFERLTAALTRWGRESWTGVERPAGTVLPDDEGLFAVATRWTTGTPALLTLPEEPQERLVHALQIAQKTGDILARIHERNGVHGSLGPKKVLCSDDHVLILDFWWSQARLKDADEPAAPETIATGAVEPSADQWAWGRLVRSLLPDGPMPVALEALLARCTAREAADRFPDMPAALAELAAVEKSIPTVDLSARPAAASSTPHAPVFGSLTVDDEAMTEDLAALAENPPAESDDTSTVGADPTHQLLRPIAGRRRSLPWILWAAALGLIAAAGIVLAL